MYGKGAPQGAIEAWAWGANRRVSVAPIRGLRAILTGTPRAALRSARGYYHTPFGLTERRRANSPLKKPAHRSTGILPVSRRGLWPLPGVWRFGAWRRLWLAGG